MPAMSKAHKQALAKGRKQARAVRDYLEALDRTKKRGPKPDKKALSKRLSDLEGQIGAEDDPAKRLELVQKRMDVQERLTDIEDKPAVDELEKEFVKVAAEYGERKGISYPAWREIGVPASVLQEAGVKRTRRT
ncbi:MAG: hypothetical protein KY469_16255 [Actinobacteria bacterium]|nr:hypothetical protein [Actinomycetota bacterium]